MFCYFIEENKLMLGAKDIPTANSQEVLVKVKAIGINHADLLQLEGKYPAPDNSNVPGLEFSGIREDNGQRVAALVSGGAYAEYVSVPCGQLINIPDDMDFITAAAIPEALVTSWLNLYCLGKIKKAMNVLIHGGASGIGSLMVQFALQEECRVLTTASDARKLSIFAHKKNCHTLSVQDDFASCIKEYGGADLIIDILGGKYTSLNLKSAAKGCKIIVLAVMDGKDAELNLGSVLMKNISIIGSTLRSKNLIEKSELVSSASKNLMPMITSKKVYPIIDSSMKFLDIPKALSYLKKRKHVGKIVIDAEDIGK